MNNQERHLAAIKKYIGKRYGRLTVISFDKQVGGNNYFLCACTCGNKKSIQLAAADLGIILREE